MLCRSIAQMTGPLYRLVDAESAPAYLRRSQVLVNLGRPDACPFSMRILLGIGDRKF